MPERDQGDHWDFLAADLGATPPPEREAETHPPESHEVEDTEGVEELTLEPSLDQIEEPSQPDLAETPADLAETQPDKPEKRQRGPKGDRVVSGFGHRRGSVDWANLARELGVEAMEEVPEPIPATETAGGAAAPTSALSGERGLVGERGDRADRSSRQAEPAVRPSASGFGAGIIDDLVSEETDGVEGEAEEEVGKGEESQEERKGRRRRRRRKPRRPEEEQASETVVAEGAEGAEEAESPAREEPAEEEKRRRGRRRGGRKRGAREEVSAESEESEEFGAGLIADHPGQNDSDDFDMLLLDEDEDEDEDATGKDGSQDERANDKKQSKRMAHRGIPSWEESVGHIIDSNLESRSKRPDASGFRQSPGRRRGGDRSGNRGRS